MDELSKQFYEIVGRTGNKAPDLQEMIALLRVLGRLPSIDQSMKYGNSLGEYSPSRNLISFHPAYGLNTNTVPHEFSHALDEAMGNYVGSIRNTNKTNAQSKFIDAYDKLDPLTSKLIPSGPKDKYRYSRDELRAHGVGNAAAPYALGDMFKMTPARQHIDSTMATEASILRDLLSRAIKPNGTDR